MDEHITTDTDTKQIIFSNTPANFTPAKNTIPNSDSTSTSTITTQSPALTDTNGSTGTSFFDTVWLSSFIPEICCMLMIATMALCAQLLNEQEIIFPEIAALVVGAWAMPTQPWKTSRLQMFLLMSISSVAGLCFVRFIPGGIYPKVLLAFLFTACILSLSRTTLIPVISACILPILLGTDSIVYPCSVCMMTAMIVLLQKLMECLHIKTATAYTPAPSIPRETLIQWGMRLVVFAAAAFLPVWFHQYYFIAPPVIVTFVELSSPDSKVRKQPEKICILITLCAVIGVLCRFSSNILGLSVPVGIVIAFLLVLIVFHQLELYFPPAGAIALLPFLLHSEGLWFYPIEVACGTIVFAVCSLLLCRLFAKIR